uniref:Uncharacterized protein n=1 Tax=Heterorhabditis bacteriophora TaxID=37862 RepID=A0A1I7X714_HETBA
MKDIDRIRARPRYAHRPPITTGTDSFIHKMGNSKSSEIKEEEIKKKPKISTDKSCSNSRKITSSARSSMSSQGNRKPILTVNQRAIIKYCLDNAKDDIADRILRRAIERKEDFRAFLDNLPRRGDISDALRDFLLGVCESLTDSDEIQKMSEEFGCSHVQFRSFGFKPDFFACTADAVTTECTFLDQATHTASETAGSWSQLTTFVFSAVRDGYYAELRRQRKTSNAFRSRPSVDVSTDGSLANDSSRRSASPATDDFSQTSESKETAKFLLPPQVY